MLFFPSDVFEFFSNGAELTDLDTFCGKDLALWNDTLYQFAIQDEH